VCERSPLPRLASLRRRSWMKEVPKFGPQLQGRRERLAASALSENIHAIRESGAENLNPLSRTQLLELLSRSSQVRRKPLHLFTIIVSQQNILRRPELGVGEKPSRTSNLTFPAVNITSSTRCPNKCPDSAQSFLISAPSPTSDEDVRQ
jgi:hypothetical protein